MFFEPEPQENFTSPSRNKTSAIIKNCGCKGKPLVVNNRQKEVQCLYSNKKGVRRLWVAGFVGANRTARLEPVLPFWLHFGLVLRRHVHESMP